MERRLKAALEEVPKISKSIAVNKIFINDELEKCFAEVDEYVSTSFNLN